MKELDLQCNKFNKRSRKYKSYRGHVGKVADNVLKRKFVATKPNQIWLTDVTELNLPGHKYKLYLSPIMDIFNGEIISYSMSFSPTISLTNKMLDKALKNLKNSEELIIHSDQGFHYQHRSWIKRLEEHKITQSMSRKGNCLDNSPMENFFGLLKQEMFYGEKFNSYEHLKKEIDGYIKWYNEERIKTKLNGMSPVQYRLHSA